MPSGLYFDANGSTPLHPEVLALCQQYLEGLYGNPSARHPAGLAARHGIDAAKASLAVSIGAQPEELWFSSGGTESNNWALMGAAQLGRGRHLLVSAVEHKSVLLPAQALERSGFEVELVPVDARGAVSARDLIQRIRKDTALVSLMHANNETGVIQPVEEVGRACRERGVWFHVDAVCTLGKIPVDVRALSCDLLTAASHKVYSPKGCGLMYIRKGVSLPAFVHGCGHQGGMRGGTENALPIVGLARAMELYREGRLIHAAALSALRDALWRGLEAGIPGVQRNGAGVLLPNTLNVYFPGQTGHELQARLGERGISVATAAGAGAAAPSHVLLAMGCSDERARASLRFSLGAKTSEESIRVLVESLVELCARKAVSA
jgi:cysteine desulfurase